MKHTALKVGLLTTCLVGGLGLFSFTDPGERTFEIMKNLDIFATLFKELNTYYVDDVNPNKTIRTGIDAMLKNLDPYTVYYPEDDIEDYMTMTTGKYNGIGILTQQRQDKFLVIMVYEGTPAEKAGIRIGDEILKIDGLDVKKPGINVDKLMKGQTGSAVKLSLRRFGQDNTEEISVTRDVVKMSNVPYFGMINDEIGYIDLKDFTGTASKEVRQAFTDLKGKGMKKVILDLRDNPGGLLNMAVDISNIFVNKDSEIVSTKGKVSEWNKTYTALNPAMDAEIPLVVLTNSRSASAAEIVAGVIQDYDRGVLIGQKSFGKGLVQITRDLSYNSKLKITTAKYYIPSGRCIQAIDYGHRNADGSVGKIPDSLQTAFKTRKSGRTVYDGGGIAPDILVDHPAQSAILTSLYRKGYIFEYANKYRHDHASIKPGREFSLSDAEYQEFVKWLGDKDYDYTTDVERKFEELEASAKKEKYYDVVQEQLKVLKTKFAHSKDSDLLKFKDEIRYMLEQEIILRYYLQKGLREHSFSKDPEIMASLKVFQDMNRYQSILKNGASK
ncbi:S41 family peptidase [Siphonobacter sp. SORGH_AS_0500]|uniref:S41 family peptidase n=1 Tax=Siphonobacter sp. SORGH_AS_0500 TaxID=1864824 RepID=UPI000CC6AA05|nr:S41 family peptidase [Siphonobacter sp. SORGH_AS_0500]MDR6193386.1 carboxyl-terminal processing protease [Siphonobacter sp. SORGH_AS_0500]PKK36840.1 peptidase S41 [Siphonobacter sp. SORGH_AS_0500]